MTDRLCSDTLAKVPNDIVKPNYQREKHGTGIVHLGVGAFHRAHQAVYTEAALNESGGDWRILGASLASNTAAKQLIPQNCLYSLVQRSPSGPEFQIVGALDNVIQANHDQQSLVSAIGDKRTRIVSMTVTEKGYGYNSASGDLDLKNPAIVRDLTHPDQPASTIGFLVSGLRTRRQAGHGGLSLMSCDNIPSNGVLLRRLTVQFAEQIDPELADWINHEVSFPATMVDRITPATTDDDLTEVESKLGVADHGAVVCEPFSQWVIEDSFVQGRPDWEAGGAQFVTDVEPFEKIKLRILNGSHSFLAYLGCLSDIVYVHELMEKPLFRKAVERLMDDTGETVIAPPKFNLNDYRIQLLDRFSNPAIQHKTAQIAMDGSKKLPQRLFEPAAERVARGLPVDSHALPIALWMRFVMVANPDQVIDPLSTELLNIRKTHASDRNAFASALLHQSSVFPSHLADNEKFVLSVQRWFSKLCQQGIEATLQELIS